MDIHYLLYIFIQLLIRHDGLKIYRQIPILCLEDKRPGNRMQFVYHNYGFICRVPVSVSHVAIGESSKELAKPNL